jgi:hypothetical protein
VSLVKGKNKYIGKKLIFKLKFIDANFNLLSQNIRGCFSIINDFIFIKINFDIHSLKLTFE